VSLEINCAPLSGCRFHFAFVQVFQATSYSRKFHFLMVLNLNRAPKRLHAQKKDEHAQFSGSILGPVSSRPFGILSSGIRRFAFCLPEKSRRVLLLPLPCCKNRKGTRMRKEKLKANFKRDRSIPNRNTTRPENVSRKEIKQMAHHAPVRRAASKARGF
jgi:hypothetical protein